MSAKNISRLFCLVSIMTLTSCASYQPNYSDSSDSSHVYNVNNGNAAGFTSFARNTPYFYGGDG